MMKKLLFSGLIFGIIAANTYGQNLGFDRQISNYLQQALSAPDMAIAFNGWIYNAYRSGDSITVKVSYDHGKSWQLFTSLYTAGCIYDAPSIVVTGTDDHNLSLFIAGIRRAKTIVQNTIFVRRYNAATGILISEPFTETTTGALYTCDLASGYTTAGKDQETFSISLLYASATAKGNSILQKTSVDEGKSFTVSNTITQSEGYFRNVSIAYGKSISASNGRYFMAWDEYSTPTAAWGKVYTSRNIATILSATTLPQRIDERSPETTGRLRHPVIAASTTADNDSSSCTVVLLAEFDRNGDGSAIAISGFSNQRAHFTNYWNRMAIKAPGAQPSVAFDPANHTFAASYYNEKDKSMELLKADFRLPQSGTWTTVAANYADGTSLTDPRPCVVIDPLYHQAALSWTSSAPDQRISFDAEYNSAPASLQEINALNEGRNNRVSWTAGTAEDEGTVTIERSTDGHTFTSLSTVAQKGSPFVNSYEDRRPEAGMNYYRIRLNAAQYSQVVSAYADFGQQKELTAYPNPAKDYLHINTRQPVAEAAVIVFDINGRACKSIPAAPGLTTIDVSSLPAGIYMVQYQNGPENNFTRITKAAR